MSKEKHQGKKMTFRGKISGICSVFLLGSIILPNVAMATENVVDTTNITENDSIDQETNQVPNEEQSEKETKPAPNEGGSPVEENDAESTIPSSEDENEISFDNKSTEEDIENPAIEKDDKNLDVHTEEDNHEESSNIESKSQEDNNQEENSESNEMGEVFSLQENRKNAISTANQESSEAQLFSARAVSITETFIRAIAPSAKEVAGEYGLYASVMIAQAALESNWGRSSLASAPNYNLFGIKGTYNGNSVTMPTYEYSEEKGWYQVNAAFRKYPSVRESLIDNANLLMNGVTWDNNIYYGTWIENTQTYKNSTNHLEGIYATDPNYDASLNNIIAQYNLTQYDTKSSINGLKQIDGFVQVNSDVVNIYSRPTTFHNSKKLSSSFLKSVFGNNKTLTFTVREQLPTKNGTFYSLYTGNTGNEKFIGWINSNDISSYKTYEKVLSTNNASYVGTIVKPNYSIDSKPYGTIGFELVGYSKDYIGLKVKVQEEKITSRGIFARILINGKNVWVDKRTLEIESVISTKNTAYVAIMNHSGHSIDTQPYGTEGYKNVASSGDYLGTTVKAIQEKVTQRGTFVLILVNGKELGWVDKRSLDIEKVTTTTDVEYVAAIIKGNYSIDSQPYGTEGYETNAKSSDYLDSIVTVFQEKTTRRGTFAYVRLDNKALGWIDIRALEKYNDTNFEKVLDTKVVSYAANIVNPQYSIDTKPYGTIGYEFVGKSADYIGLNIKVTEEKVTERGTFAKIFLNGSNVWLDKRALDIETVLSTKETSYVAKINKPNFSIDTKPYGTVGFENVAASSDYIGEQVKALQEKITRRGTFVLISYAGKQLGWLDKKALELEEVIKTAEKNYTAKIAYGNFTIDTKPYGTESFSFVDKAQKYLGKVVEVNQEKITTRGTFAHITIDGKELGWVDTKAFDNIIEKVISTKNIVYASQIARPNYSIDTTPYGTKGSKLVGTSRDYIGKKAIASQEKVTQRGTFVLIKADGKELGWIDKRALDIETVLSTKKVDYSGVISKNNYSIDTQPYGIEGFSLISYSNDYIGKKVAAMQEKTSQRGTFVLIFVNGKELGWIDKKALTI